MKKNQYLQLGYVKASKYRTDVLCVLKDGVLCPKEISEKTKYHTSHVSTTLTELQSRNLVVCINPEARKGRLYRLTSDGKTICAQLS